MRTSNGATRTTTMTRRLARAVLIAGLALPTSALLGGLGPIPAVEAKAATNTIADFKGVLADYGTFVSHAKYGEVWVPSVTPQGWHPYQPCHWVNTKYGWYFQDNTPWGKIVHHYGRWAHDAAMGWIWVPGQEWSPGWVVWRTSEQWVGWAPMLPDADIKTISADAFNNDKMWIFMEAEKFGKSCTGDTTVAAAQYPAIFATTQYVTEVAFVDGIAVFVLPSYLYGPIIDIDIDINVWSPTFVFIVMNNWTWIWNNITINIITCTSPPNTPSSVPKRPQPPKRTDLTPPPPPPPGGGGRKPSNRVNLSTPGGSSGPPIRTFDPTPSHPRTKGTHGRGSHHGGSTGGRGHGLTSLRLGGSLHHGSGGMRGGTAVSLKSAGHHGRRR
jgi:hypothetical protein